MIKTGHEKIKKWEDVLWIALLLLVASISHWEWFRFGNVLTFADTWFQHPETLNEAFRTNTWIENSGFGVPNIQLYKLLFFAFQSFLSKIGFQFTDVLRITHLIPIAIFGFLSPYFLIRYLTREKLIAFIGALFYGSTTLFILRQYLGHSSVAFIVALAPLILYLFLLALEKNKTRQWLVFILTYWVGLCYEPRIMYIVTIVLGIYFLFFGISSLKKVWAKILVSIVLLIGLSAFWILPIALGGFSEVIGDVAGRVLFGNAYYSILRSLSLFHSWWTGAQPLIFSLQPIPWYFWLVPAFTILFFLFRPDKENKKIIAFFGVVWLLGLFLTKQAGAPFPDAFQWLRENIPGFLIFRSGSKFWFVLSLGYMGLLSFGLLWLKKRWGSRFSRLAFAGIAAVIIILSLWNLKPLIMGEFGGMFAEREIPKDYLIFKEYLMQQNDSFRTFWTPTDSRWGIYTNQKPKISNIGIIGDEWKNYVSLKLGYKKLSVNEQIMEIFKINGANELFDISSIKYIVVPIRDVSNDDDFFIYYGGKTNPNIRDWYISELDKIEWLKRIDIGTNELVVYENENYKPHFYIPQKMIYSKGGIENLADIMGFGDYQIRSIEPKKTDVKLQIPKITFVKINPTKYKIKVEGAGEPYTLVFSESFHQGWKAYININGTFENKEIVSSYFNGEIKEGTHKNIFFDKNTFETWGKKPIAENRHFIANGYANSWYIVPEDANGKENYEIIIEFWPQRLFYIGLTISAFTFLGCLCYLVYDLYMKKKRLKVKQVNLVYKS